MYLIIIICIFFPLLSTITEDVEIPKNKICQTGQDGVQTQCECNSGWTGDDCTTATCDGYKGCGDGKCIIKSNTHTCECDSYHKGLGCEFKACDRYINCRHGKCIINENADDVCSCKNGYYGEECDKFNCTDDKECHTSKCDTQTEKCVCHSNFTGFDCSVATCRNLKCPENTKCEIVNRSPKCVCLDNIDTRNCFLKECGRHMDCLNNGICMISDNDKYECHCVTGTSGYQCQTIKCIDAKLPCLNGGSCQSDANNVARCECTSQYTGTLCEYKLCDKEINCGKHATECYEDGKKKICICENNYKGSKCEIHSCDKVECQHGSRCYKENNELICGCLPGFKGKLCEALDCTTGNPCLHGNCVKNQEVSQCNCNFGWTGDLCDKKNCESNNLCPSFAKCTYKNDIADCVCSVTLEKGGIRDVLNCMKQTVYPQGTCYYDKEGEKRECFCTNNYSGDKCEHKCENDCNFGSCEFSKELNKTFCSCDIGYTGDECSDRITTISPLEICRKQYCNSHGTCKSKIDHTCDCDENYFGENCQFFCPTSCQTRDCMIKDNLVVCNDKVSEQTLVSNTTILRPEEKEKNECSQESCNNHGVCYIENEHEYCKCSQGFIGVNCEIDCVTLCTSGECVLQNNKPTCVQKETPKSLVTDPIPQKKSTQKIQTNVVTESKKEEIISEDTVSGRLFENEIKLNSSQKIAKSIIIGSLTGVGIITAILSIIIFIKYRQRNENNEFTTFIK